MRRFPGLFPLLSGLLLLGAATAGKAAPVGPSNGNATATARVHSPISYRNLRELNFAYLSVTTAGTAVVNPNNDTMTTTGGVLRVGGTPYAAQFEAVSPVRGVVIIRLPRNPITVTRVGGTETMTVSNWTVDGGNRRTVAEQQPFSFKVGGTLFVNANQADGTYVGTFTVDVQYP